MPLASIRQLRSQGLMSVHAPRTEGVTWSEGREGSNGNGGGIGVRGGNEGGNGVGGGNGDVNGDGGRDGVGTMTEVEASERTQDGNENGSGDGNGDGNGGGDPWTNTR